VPEARAISWRRLLVPDFANTDFRWSFTVCTRAPRTRILEVSHSAG
jgi:hypothetical protein